MMLVNTTLASLVVVRSSAGRVSLDRSLAVLIAAVTVAIILLLVSQAFTARRRVRDLEESFGQRVQDWISGEKTRIMAEQSVIARREAQVSLADWKRREEEAIRQDAIKRSQSVIVGKVTEHMVPFLPDFSWNPKDARFMGSPIDFLVFDGLDAGQLRSIVFVEVKTASSVLTNREKQIREAVEARRIAWREIRIDRPASQSRPSLPTPAQLPAPATPARRLFK